MILYQYGKTRSKSNIQKFLEGFSGTLVSDAFSGYKSLDKNDENITSLTVLGIGTCGLLILLRSEFPKLFTQEPAVLAFASEGLLIMSCMCIFHGIDRCLVNAMRGAGKAVVPMITAQFGAFSRIPLAYYLGVCRDDYRGIFYALLTAAFLRTAAIALYYYGGGWKRAVSRIQKMNQG